MIYDYLESKISGIVSELYAITRWGTKSCKSNVEQVHVFKKVCKDPSSLIVTNTTSTRSRFTY